MCYSHWWCDWTTDYYTKKWRVTTVQKQKQNKLTSKIKIFSEKSIPQFLLSAIFFFTMGSTCTLLSAGIEHCQLWSHPCPIEIVEHFLRPYLRYSDDVSKNHQGGLEGWNIKPKVAIHHSNDSNPERCFVRLFRHYHELCPNDAPSHDCYLQPSRTQTDTCWYSRCPVGCNTLSTAVAWMCKLPGITRYKTNHIHSLCAIATSRLYQSGVNEQLVMEWTGHRSVKVSISVRDLTSSERHCQAFRTAQIVAPIQRSTSASANLFLAWEEVFWWFGPLLSPVQRQNAHFIISSAQLASSRIWSSVNWLQRM